MKFIRKILPVLVILLFFSCSNKSKIANDKIVLAPANDPELKKATEEALSHINYFVAQFTKMKYDTNYFFSVKADFISGEDHEHMWIRVDSNDNETVSGLLANDPGVLKNIKFADRVTIKRYDIEDWIIANNASDNYEGGYSVKVLKARDK